MVEAVQEALGRLGIDEVVAAGMFFPRGHSGAMFAGGLVGGAIGDALGGAAADVGVAGAISGQRASDAASGLPERMLIDETSSSRVELEGERLPGFHVSDVIDALQS